MDEVEFASCEDAREGLKNRGVPEEGIGELASVVQSAAHAIITEYDLQDRVDEDELKTVLQIGYTEAISEYLDAGVRDAEDLQTLVEAIRDDPISNSRLVVGRMNPRSAAALRVSQAMWSRKHNSD